VLSAQGSEITLCVADLNLHLTVVKLQKLLNDRKVSLATTTLLDLIDLEKRTRPSCSLPLRVLPFRESSLPEGIIQVRLKLRDSICQELSALGGTVVGGLHCPVKQKLKDLQPIGRINS
jgi:hypothetical protein